MEPVTQTATGSIGPAAEALARIKAAAMDLWVVVGWAAFSGAIGGVLRLLDLGFHTPSAWDMYAFVTLVAPVAVNFALIEASPRQATPGKRRLNLVVIDAKESQLTRSRSLARSAVKFVPWQMAHTAVFQLFARSTAAGHIVLSIAAQILVVASIATMALDSQHRALHDLIARTRVVAATRDRGLGQTAV
ncbi:MAG: RDD family protein [Acidimicrobiia bacterium]|nr:RDD family protein [Acidimicrobiia bacterium]